MKKYVAMLSIAIMIFMLAGCNTESNNTAAVQEAKAVNSQQDQYAIGQPLPKFDWSLERHLIIQLYMIRNQRVSTHSVWRSDHGVIEGDCPSMGFGLPYDTSLTNPLVATDIDQQGEEHHYQGGSLTSIEQAEPNGIFASKNTAATWVMCIGDAGTVEPIYVETKVTTYPYPVTVDYGSNRVTKAGKSSVSIGGFKVGPKQ